jgi:Ankyrin repeats (3 copies)
MSIFSLLNKGDANHNLLRFRWAVCQMDTFANCLTPKMLRKALANLPPTLDSTYERILESIPSEYSKYAASILQWLAFSMRPLLLEEIQEVVAIDVDRDPMFDPEDVLQDPLDLWRICSSLITITKTVKDPRFAWIYVDEKRSYQIVALAHYSVKEYLISERSHQAQKGRYSLQETDGHEHIAKSCLGYLFKFHNSTSLSSEIVADSELARYSTIYWTQHAKAAGDKDALNRQIMAFFATDHGAYRNWTLLHDPRYRWHQQGALDGIAQSHLGLMDVPTPLYFASLFDLPKIVELLLNGGANINALSKRRGTALHAASIRGNTSIVELLLNAGADINATERDYGSMIQDASRRGHIGVVELLLSAGADPNANESERYSTAL